MIRIELNDPSLGVQLRDYFLGLGAHAAVDEAGAVDAHFPETGLDPDACLDRWIDGNPGVWARVLTFAPADA